MRTSLYNSMGLVALVLVAIAAFASPSFAAETAQGKAASAALFGPEVKKLKVAGHEFNVKKAKITRNASGMVITGQLSHCLTLRPDDQLYYTIRKSGGKVTAMEIKINRGGLAVYVSKLANHFVGHPVAVDKIDSLVRALGRKVDGKWESSADLIVATIALKAPGGFSQQDIRAPLIAQPAVSDGSVRDHRTPRSTATTRRAR